MLFAENIFCIAFANHCSSHFHWSIKYYKQQETKHDILQNNCNIAMLISPTCILHLPTYFSSHFITQYLFPLRSCRKFYLPHSLSTKLSLLFTMAFLKQKQKENTNVACNINPSHWRKSHKWFAQTGNMWSVDWVSLLCWPCYGPTLHTRRNYGCCKQIVMTHKYMQLRVASMRQSTGWR